MPFYERQPYIQALHQIVKEVMRGDIRVPRFHPQAAWRPEHRGDLLDSLYRGFPVGTVLLWPTATPIPTHDIVGGFKIPPLPVAPGTIYRLLLDGHQRLATLVQILGPGLLADLANEGANVIAAEGTSERWFFELEPEGDPENSRDRFVLLKPGHEPKATQVPLSIILHRSQVNRWVRDNELSDDLATAVDNLRDRLREYSMPVSVLAADSLKEATESFKRINSGATPLSDFHMVAALAFDEENDPQQQFAEARSEHLSPVGWGGVSDTDVLRVAAGLGDRKNPAQLDVAELADRIRKDRGLIERAFGAVVAATELLRSCGVLGPESLPYAWQLMTLAVHLGRASAQVNPSTFDDASAPAAQRWFWLTTYGEVFAGVNSAVVDRGLGALRDLLDGKPWSRMERDVTRQVRPVNNFDFRTARSKACALAMARHQDRGDAGGPAHRALTIGVESMQLLTRGGKRSRWWHLVIATPETGVSALREALKRRAAQSAEPGDQEMLDRIGVAPADAGTVEDLLAARRDRLLAAERAFVDELGLAWAPEE